MKMTFGGRYTSLTQKKGGPILGRSALMPHYCSEAESRGEGRADSNTNDEGSLKGFPAQLLIQRIKFENSPSSKPLEDWSPKHGLLSGLCQYGEKLGDFGSLLVEVSTRVNAARQPASWTRAQLRSLKNRWAEWLDAVSHKLDLVHITGRDRLVAAYNDFERSAAQDLKNGWGGLIVEPTECNLRVARQGDHWPSALRPGMAEALAEVLKPSQAPTQKARTKACGSLLTHDCARAALLGRATLIAHSRLNEALVHALI